MKEIVLKQYIQVVRTVKMTVEDDCDAHDAAMELDNMPLCLDPNDALSKMPENAVVTSSWDYVSDLGIEDENGEVVLNNG